MLDPVNPISGSENFDSPNQNPSRAPLPHHMAFANLDTMNDSANVIREQDRLLPIANVSRIMKYAVPTNAKIAKDAKETVQECVSEFISFVTSEASDRCNQEKRKTINGEDIIWAMENLGFDNYVQLLKIYLIKYKEVNYIILFFIFVLLYSINSL